MLRLLLALALIAGSAAAQSAGGTVKAKELAAPGKSTQTPAAPAETADSPQPSVVAPSSEAAAVPAPQAAPSAKSTETKPAPAANAARPSETPSESTTTGRVAAFWFILPGK